MTDATGGLSLASARLAAKGLAFVSTILIARYLNAQSFGEYSLVTTFALLFSYLADFGLVSLLIREIARTPERMIGLLTDGVTAQVCVSTIATVALILIGLLFESNLVIRVGIMLAAAGLFFESLGRPLGGAMIARGRITLSAALIAVTSVANTGLLLLALSLRLGLLALVAAAIPVGLFSSLLRAAFSRSCATITGLRISRRSFTLLKESFPFALLAGSVILYNRVDMLFLSGLSGNAAVGVYSAADRVVEGILVIPAAVGAALYPALAAHPDQAVERLFTTLRWSVPLGGLGTTLSLFPGGMLVALLYGARYSGVESAFQLLVPTILLGFFTVPLAYLLQARVRTELAMFATITGLIVDVASNLVLIPRLSFRGAAVSATVAELAVALSLMAMVRLTERQGGQQGPSPQLE